MIRRVYSLFRRYMVAHDVLSAPPQNITDEHGALLGHVDMVRAEWGRLSLSGWVVADRVSLRSGESVQVTERPSGAPGRDPLNFHFAVPCLGESLNGGLDITLEADGGRPLQINLRHPSTTALVFGFLRASFAALPAAIRWQQHHEPMDKAKVKRLLGLDGGSHVGLIPDMLFADVAARQDNVPPPSIVIVLPVFNAHEVLIECLERVERHTDLLWHLIIVEDFSSDRRVRPFLQGWAAQRPENVTLILHDENKGFVESANAGLSAARVRSDLQPVVILNSDALVPPRWASRLLEPMLEASDVASVTPLSNDAELHSVPTICAPTSLPTGASDRIDAEAARLSPAFTGPELPTGVGFCMALNPAYLRKVPTFDTAFGRGYGEEVDWCQKTAALGGRHVAQHRLFVEHRSGQSFSQNEKKISIIENGRLVSSRYPRFDAEVQDFIAGDPLCGARLALAVAWAAAVVGAEDSIPIYLCHSLGGGAEHALQGLVGTRAEAGEPSVLLRVGGPDRWQLEVAGPSGVTRGGTNDFAVVERLLEPLTKRHVVYSCGVGDSDPASLPKHILALAKGPDDTLEVTFHDYLPISPAYTLLDQDGVYHPDAHRAPELATWQARWGSLIEAAAQVTVFSRSSERLVTETWPDSAARINYAPHPVLGLTSPAKSLCSDVPSNAPRVVAVLGNINHHKGATVLKDLAQLTNKRRSLELVLIGNVDPSVLLPSKVKIHGTYYPDQISSLAARYGVTAWLIPSVWPETFSFTTHEALATGLPVFAFNIGAQGDAVSDATNGIAVPYTSSDRLAETLLDAIVSHRSTSAERPM